jgi:hypothetical protein
VPRGDDPNPARLLADRLRDEREVGVERLRDVVGERPQERLADDPGGAGRDRAQQVALAGGAGVGEGWFEESGQGGRNGAGSRDPRW